MTPDDNSSAGSRRRVTGVSRVVARADHAIAAGGHVQGNAIGPGSSATFIDTVTINIGASSSTSATRLLPPLRADSARRSKEESLIVDALLTHATRRSVVLEGRGGTGKTTLAISASEHPAVAARYPGGVVWIQVGQSRVGAALARHLGDICTLLGGHRPTTTDPALAGAALTELLDARPPTLVIIDDVWVRAQADAFMAGAESTTRLFTTRNRRLAPPDSTVIEIDSMTRYEAEVTVLSGLEGVTAAVISPLIEYARGWPVLLGLINGALRSHLKAGGAAADVVDWIVERVTDDGPAALDPSVADDALPSVRGTMAASLSLLTDDEQERYFDLAVFTDDIDVPEAVVALLWQVRGRMKAGQSSRLLSKLSDLRLIESRWAGHRPAIAFHDELRDYLIHRLSARQLRARHGSLVTGFSYLLPGRRAERCWWNLGVDDSYAIGVLTHHLVQAGALKEFRRLASDPRWIRTQIEHLGSVVPALADLAIVPGDLAVDLYRDLETASDILVGDPSPNAVAATLATRIGRDANAGSSAALLLEEISGLHLRATWPLPDRTPSVGHNGPIGDCAISPDGTLLATASDDRLVIIWDLSSLTVKQVLKGHRQRARACEFSPDGMRLLSAGMDGTTRVWSVHTGALLDTFGDRLTRTLGCAWAPLGDLIAYASGDGSVTVVDVKTGEPRHRLKSESDEEWDCAFAPDGASLATAGRDGTIRFWDVHTGLLIRAVKAHDDFIRCCAFDRAGGKIATAGGDNVVRVLDPLSGQIVRTLIGHTDRVRSCTFSPDGALLATASEDRTVRIWEVSTGAEIKRLAGHTDWVGGCAFTPDGTLLVTCGGDAIVRLWNVQTGELVRMPRDIHSAAESCSVSPDETRLLIGCADGRFEVLDAGTGARLVAVQAHVGRVLSCALGTGQIVTGGADGAVRLWSLDGAPMKTLQSHDGRVWSCAVSPDQRLVASVGEDGVVLLQEAATGTTLLKIRSHVGRILDCAFDSEGSRLATVGNDGVLRIWRVTTGELLAEISTSDTALWTCEFSRDGSTVIVAGEPTGHVNFLGEFGAAATGPIHVTANRVNDCALSPTGALLATCDDDGRLEIWDVADRQRVTAIRVSFPLKACSWVGSDDRAMFVVGGGGVYSFELVNPRAR